VEAPPSAESAPRKIRSPLLLVTALVIATCGLVYELLAGTLASYVLGDSVTQFSTIIGVYLSAMGLGSYLSRYAVRGLARWFVEVELAVALVGGALAPLLFLSFAHLSFFRVVLYGAVAAVGVLVGLEIPLLIRILRGRIEFRDLVARVLTVDYLGALVASLLFPIFLMPKLGLVRTSLVFGALNAAVALWSTWVMRPLLGGVGGLRLRGAVVLAVLGVGITQADRLTLLAEEGMFADEVVYAKSSAYQRIVVTQSHSSFHLFLNGQLQFSSADEYRYHEALVHPALAVAHDAKHVLVLGGGDGLAVREILRHPEIEQVMLVDLDPEMIHLARDLIPVRKLNRDSLRDNRVTVINDDAMKWLEKDVGVFDVVIVDFPDPSTYSLGKLYTTRFYRLLARHVSPTGAVAVQSTSPLMARQSFWCIARTLEEAGFQVRPYHVAVPSFGEWGFMLASLRPFEIPGQLPAGLRFLTAATLPTLFQFPGDMGQIPAEVNRLNNQVLVSYYEDEVARWN
jgi:spermidine synthase